MRLVLEGLRKRYGAVEVLRGVDLVASPGRITALVGPNAAGKSTLIKTVIGLVRADGGRVTVDGTVVDGGQQYRERVGYMPQMARFPEHLTGGEVLTLLRRLRGPGAPVDEALIDDLDLRPSLPRPVGTLSGGTRQKLNAVVAFLFQPSLVILDEPTAGLDPVASGVLKGKVAAAAAAGGAILLTSHILSEVEELADDIVFLTEGRAVFQGPIARLLAEAGETRLERAVARLMRGGQ